MGVRGDFLLLREQVASWIHNWLHRLGGTVVVVFLGGGGGERGHLTEILRISTLPFPTTNTDLCFGTLISNITLSY